MYTRKYHYARIEEKAMAQARADEDQVPAVGLTADGKVLWRVKPRYRTLEDIRRRNARSGGHWFSSENMRFFSSRVQSSIYVAKDGRAYFVSSERDRYAGSYLREKLNRQPRRLYTVRVAELSGGINTIGEFQGYQTGRAAHAAARKAAGL